MHLRLASKLTFPLDFAIWNLGLLIITVLRQSQLLGDSGGVIDARDSMAAQDASVLFGSTTNSLPALLLQPHFQPGPTSDCRLAYAAGAIRLVQKAFGEGRCQVQAAKVL